MSFVDLLRRSRSTPVATLHKFLTHYDPATKRIYAFVEGEPDRIFYRMYLEKYASSPSEIFVYNCEGKSKVYDAYRDVAKRYPDCRRVLFFIDKDVDDIVGVVWPSDPRIFTTGCYSIENYVICDETCGRYFRDFVKIRRVEIDLMSFLEEFSRERKKFHALLLPVMAWVIAIRRRGGRIVLTNVNLDELFILNGTTVSRRRDRTPVSYLENFRQPGGSSPNWKEVRAICRELKRLDSRSYARGHFESWWFMKFIRKVCEDLTRVVSEAGGSVSFSASLAESNFIQILCAGVPAPSALETFLRFHLGDSPVGSTTSGSSSSAAKVSGWFSSLFGRRGG
jgi:hypothetical protein